MNNLSDVVQKVISDFVESSMLFTALDVSNKVKETLPFAVRQSLKYGDSFYFVVKTKEGTMAGLRRIDNKDIDFIEYDEVGIELDGLPAVVHWNHDFVQLFARADTHVLPVRLGRY